MLSKKGFRKHPLKSRRYRKNSRSKNMNRTGKHFRNRSRKRGKHLYSRKRHLIGGMELLQSNNPQPPSLARSYGQRQSNNPRPPGLGRPPSLGRSYGQIQSYNQHPPGLGRLPYGPRRPTGQRQPPHIRITFRMPNISNFRSRTKVTAEPPPSQETRLPEIAERLRTKNPKSIVSRIATNASKLVLPMVRSIIAPDGEFDSRRNGAHYLRWLHIRSQLDKVVHFDSPEFSLTNTGNKFSNVFTTYLDPMYDSKINTDIENGDRYVIAEYINENLSKIITTYLEIIYLEKSIEEDTDTYRPYTEPPPIDIKVTSSFDEIEEGASYLSNFTSIEYSDEEEDFFFSPIFLYGSPDNMKFTKGSNDIDIEKVKSAYYSPMEDVAILPISSEETVSSSSLQKALPLRATKQPPKKKANIFIDLYFLFIHGNYIEQIEGTCDKDHSLFVKIFNIEYPNKSSKNLIKYKPVEILCFFFMKLMHELINMERGNIERKMNVILQNLRTDFNEKMSRQRVKPKQPNHPKPNIPTPKNRDNPNLDTETSEIKVDLDHSSAASEGKKDDDDTNKLAKILNDLSVNKPKRKRVSTKQKNDNFSTLRS